jgi:hypothetical protein
VTDDQPPAWYLAVQKRAHDEAPTIPEATVLATEYTVNCVPEDDINGHGFEIRVQYRGAGRYAVIQHGHLCLGADGTWDQGVKEYDRGDDWLNAHRFDLDTALRLAKEQAPLVTVNGHTVSDTIRMQQTRAERHG